MKKFKQLVKELPSKKVVFAFGRYQPPTIGHGLLVAAVKHIAQKQGADHIIYASRSQDKKSNPLPVDRKVYYLKRMFPGTNFVAANDQIRTFIEAVKALNKKYKNLVMVAGSDRVAEYQKILNKYNGKDFHYDTIEVVSAGERDPDAEGASGMSGTKMREAAKKGDFTLFKKGLPSSLTTQDAKRLMNELREAMGGEAVKEAIEFHKDELREKFHAGKVFNIGEKVQDKDGVYEIVDRGTNYISVVNESGIVSKKWINAVEYAKVVEDVQPGPAPEEITFKGYTTKNLHHSHDAAKAFQGTIDRLNKGMIPNDPVAILNALKATDTYMKINDLHIQQGVPPKPKELEAWKEAHSKARDSLQRLGEFMHHEDYWHMHEHEVESMLVQYNVPTAGADFADSYIPQGSILEMKFTSSDKIKVARIIATTLGVADVDKKSNAEQLVNDGLRKIRSKPMRPEYVDVLHKMLQTAADAGIDYDKKLVPQKAKEVSEAIDKEHPIAKEYNALKQNDIKTLRNMIKGQQRIVDTSGYTSKDHAISAYLRHKHGDKKVAAAMGLKEDNLDELSSELLGRYKKGAAADASAADKAGDYKKGNKRFSGIIKATNKQFDNDMKKHVKEETDVERKSKTYSDILDKITTAKLMGKPTDEFLRQLSAFRPDQPDQADTIPVNPSDVDKETLARVTDQSVVGHAMSPDESHSTRKMKIHYRTEETETGAEVLSEDEYSSDYKTKEYVDKETGKTKERKSRAKEIVFNKGEGEGNRIKEEEEKEDDEMSDDDLDSMVDGINHEDDILDAYDDDELAMVDDETGEEIEDDEEDKKVDEEALSEVLSRAERMRAKVRFSKTKSKRERKIKIALKRRSDTKTINTRSRRLAIKLMKQRIAKKPLNSLSVSEKERVEAIIQRRKAVINRLAMKLVPRVKKIEQDRLTHRNYTK